MGITNQRETTIVWDRQTGEPIANAIVWQDRRTAAQCAELKEVGAESLVRERTGLVIDPYFSGTKIAWLLDNVPGARARAERGELAFGTVDTWLAWHLTGNRTHVTDVSNASRTLLFNIHMNDWDAELLELLRVPRAILPEVHLSAHAFGMLPAGVLGEPLVIGGIAGDQQAAMFGQACHRAGMAKNTYGTGCFMLLHTGDKVVQSSSGLIATACADAGQGVRLEGSVFVGGAVVQWLRDGLEFFKSSSEMSAWPPVSSTPGTCTSCRPSPASAHRTGIPTRAARFQASPGHPARTSRALRSSPSPSKAPSCLRQCKRILNNNYRNSGSTAEQPPTTS